MLASNTKAKERVSDLQDFVSRFSANKSKARQATSRLKQIEKIKSEVVEVKPSSRQAPFIRFEMDDKDKLHRQAVELLDIAKGYDRVLFHGMNVMLDAGERLGVIGPNGAGKTTLLKALMGEIEPDQGTVKWAEKARIGYFAQDHAHDFDNDLNVFDWMKQWRQKSEDDQTIRGILGRLLFSGDDVKKSVRVLSGGEKGRMLYGKLMLEYPNVMIMDEPTNHMDMETIEALNISLEKYKGTLIFVSHDRQFVSSLATQIIELDGRGGYRHFSGNYEDYLASQGVV
jgi:ATPase subunit of ABC transporter with duplicated ATPase domains